MNLPQMACTSCVVDPYKDTYGLASSPHNKNSDFGITMLQLYDITGKEEYLNIIKGVALNFKSKMIWQNQGQYYSWHYYDPTWLGDFEGRLGFNCKAGIWIEHRNGYGNISLKFATECYRRGIVFGKEDIDRYIYTNREIMWDGVATITGECGVAVALKTWAKNDGSMPTQTSDCGGLYNALCPYDATLENLGYNGFANAPTSWGSKLSIPLFVKTMKLTGTDLNPPDTLGWVGPLEALSTEPINAGHVRVTFYNEVDPSSITDMENFSFSRGIEAISTRLDPSDAHILDIFTIDQEPGNLIKLRIRNVKDIYGNETFAYPNNNQPYLFTSSALPSDLSDYNVRLPGAATYLKVGPNPASGPVSISYLANKSEPDARISIYNQWGRLVYNMLNSNQVHGINTIIRDQPSTPGLYYVRVENNQKSITRTFVRIQ